MALKNLVTIGLCFSLGACAFKKNDAQEKEKAQNTTEALDQFQKSQDEKRQLETKAGVLTAENVSVEFIEQPQPERYRMIVSWPSSVPSMIVQINDEFETTTTSSNSYQRDVRSNTTYRIKLISKDSQGTDITRREFVKESPKDLIIKDTISLSKNSNESVNRIFFFPNAQIITNGYDLSLTTNKLIVEKIDSSNSPYRSLWRESQILTTVDQTTSRAEQLAGSKITITAKKAIGELHVALIGYNGTDGRSGTELDTANNIQRQPLATLNGIDGASGKLKTFTPPCAKSRSLDGPVCDGPQLKCEVAPENGQNGKQGSVGTNGENGSNGGSSGSLFIHVADAKEFTVEVGQKTGLGGRGGNGGIGSPGGFGGKAGNNPGSPCPNALDGKPGPAGLTGWNGAQGKDGTLGSIETGGVQTKVFPL